MMKSRPQYCLLGILTSWICAFGQIQEYQFTRINTLSASSLGQVNFITEDKHGFIWFTEESESALSRFDGFTLRRYRHNPGDSNSLGGTHPECILIDQDDIMWIGFFGQGLDRFDPDTETFMHLRADSNKTNGLANAHISDMVQGPDGMIYIATFGGLHILDPSTLELQHFQHDPENDESIGSDILRELYFDSEGVLWIGAGWFVEGPGGLIKYDLKTRTFKNYRANPNDKNALQNDRVTAIFEDSKGNFWVGTGGDGLHSFDRETESFTHHPYSPIQPESVSVPPFENFTYGVTFIDEDPMGNLWVGGEGVDVYNLQTGYYRHFGNNTDFDGTVIENSSWCAFIASNGLIWLSTQPGVYKIDPFNFAIAPIPKPVPVILTESDSISWIGTPDGLIRENVLSGTKSIWSHRPKDPNSLSSNDIESLYQDGQGIVWIGTDQGLNRLDPNTGILNRYAVESPKVTPHKYHSTINSISEATDNKLWIGTRTGLFLMDCQKDSFQYYDVQKLAESTSTILFDVSFVARMNKEEVWIGHHSAGKIFKLNPTKSTAEGYLLGNGQFGIVRDSNGKVWVSSQNGLYVYQENENNFRKIINSSCYGLVSDQKGSLWTNTVSKIIRVDSKSETIISYDVLAPVQYGNVFVPRTSKGFLQSDGTIVLGDSRKHYHIDPAKFKLANNSADLLFTNLWISSRTNKSADQAISRSSLLGREAINLSFLENSFSLSFTETDFRNPTQNKINYRLDPYDIDWRETLSEERVFYSNISPGKYEIKISAPNSSTGQWAENSLIINIAPPWYRTYWAYALYGLLLLGLIYQVDRYRKRQVLKKARAKARELELKQAQELKKAYVELEKTHAHLQSTQKQLIHAEKMASLGELTAGIAHEIQNPLNFVNNFSEVSVDLLQEANDELQKGDLTSAKEIIEDLNQNLSKIKHHGHRASGIVRSMLDHSRGTAGEKSLTDLNALCDEFVRLAYHGMRAKDTTFNATINTQFDQALPSVAVVPQDIGRVILNLMTNAFFAVHQKKGDSHSDYMPSVSIKTEKQSQQLVITVADNGSGILPEIQDKIFQPFFTTKETGSGTGLGLSLSYDIIKAHNGDLSVSSKPGKGSTFKIVLPLETKISQQT